MVTSIMKIEIDYTRHLWQLVRLTGPTFEKQNLDFGGMTFCTKTKSMKSNKNMKLALNVD